MIEIEIPGRGRLRLAHLVLDVNGTVAVDGMLVDGVVERIEMLRERIAVHWVTADTHGRQSALDDQLGIRAVRIEPGREREQKANLVRQMGAETVCYIGNGANDAAALAAAGLGIAVLGTEGVALEALTAADLLAPSICDALDLLLRSARLVATLRR